MGTAAQLEHCIIDTLGDLAQAERGKPACGGGNVAHGDRDVADGNRRARSAGLWHQRSIAWDGGRVMRNAKSYLTGKMPVLTKGLLIDSVRSLDGHACASPHGAAIPPGSGEGRRGTADAARRC